LSVLESMEHQAVILRPDATHRGAEESVPDGIKCGRCLMRSGNPGGYRLLPNFGKERASRALTRKTGACRAGAASDDDLDKKDLVNRRARFAASCRCARCCAIAKSPLPTTALHSCAITSDAFWRDDVRGAIERDLPRGRRA
jgi:hypothetical protein